MLRWLSWLYLLSFFLWQAVHLLSGGCCLDFPLGGLNRRSSPRIRHACLKTSVMTRKEKEYAIWCVEHDTHKFYTWGKWIKTRKRVLAADRYECQRCKTKYKRFRKASTVHHINHLKVHPEIALDMFFTDPLTHEKRRNLISLCHDCHEEVHDFRKQKKQSEEKIFTEERWD